MKIRAIISVLIFTMLLTSCNNDTSTADYTYEESEHSESAFEWYMSSADLMNAINVSDTPRGSDDYTWIDVYDHEIYGKSCDATYSFNRDGLESIICSFNIATDKDGQSEAFNSLKSSIEMEYGMPDIEETRVNGTGLPCSYVEWYTDHTHISLLAYMEKEDDFEVSLYFSPTEYQDVTDKKPSESTSVMQSANSLLTVPHGEVLDVNITGDTLIIKTKITSSLSNHSTISQNFFNLEDLIKNQGCSTYEEIQYWAVADMSDGSESKVVSFTAPKSTIDGIKDGSIDAIAYLDEYGYLEDVYILPSLQE